MDILKDVITPIITILNAFFVAFLSIREIRREKIGKLEGKKKSWYQSEVISDAKIRRHIDDMRDILMSGSPKYETCEKINDAMLDFFYTSVNYVAFFDIKYCESLKSRIMEAADQAMYSILTDDDELTRREADKILKVYRMKIIYLFYEFDMKMDKTLK